MKEVSKKLTRIARKSWSNPSIRKLIVAGIVAGVGLTGLEVSGTTAEALGAVLMLVLAS